MNAKKSLAEDFDWDVAHDYMDKAVREGRTEDDGFEDYLASLGFTRTKDIQAFLQKFREEDRELTERIRHNLNQIRKIVRAAQQQYAGV
jgi:hypothetical protein